VSEEEAIKKLVSIVDYLLIGMQRIPFPDRDRVEKEFNEAREVLKID
jgi:hydrogenase maturation factor HypF (carbamoyltransferase family)